MTDDDGQAGLGEPLRSRPGHSRGSDSSDSPTGNKMVDLAAPMWSARHTAEQLGLTPDELRTAREEGRVLGLTPIDSDRISYPVAQFERTPDGTVRVKVGLRGFLKTLLVDGGRDPWTCVIVLNTPAPELEGMTPLAWTRSRRDPTRLDAYARLINAEFLR